MGVVIALAGYTDYVLYPRFHLPPVEGAGLLAMDAASDVASFFSPCTSPLLVALLGGHSAEAWTSCRGARYGHSVSSTFVGLMNSAIFEWWDKFRSNFFFVPLLFAIVGVLTAEGLLEADRRITDFPDRLSATVDSARALLALVAGATLTFAAIAFSVSLLLISAASSQYSPRIVHGLFRDPFTKRVMGVVVGTFVYCLVVMRSVRGPLEEAGAPVIPNFAVLVGGLLGLISILAIVAYINHAAHSMEVSTLLERVTREALKRHSRNGEMEIGQEASEPADEGDGLVVHFDEHGWVQTIDHALLLGATSTGSTVRVQTAAGRYAIPSTPICRISPKPDDHETVGRKVRSAVSIGPTRTLVQDETFGVRQLADVALKALSPGVNDPTTAQDALFHMGSVVRELLDRPPVPKVQRNDNDQTLVLAETFEPSQIVALAFDEIRLASAGQPTVLIYLLEIIRLVIDSLDDTDHPDAIASLTRQAELVAEVGERSDLPRSDHEKVQAAFESKFSGR